MAKLRPRAAAGQQQSQEPPYPPAPPASTHSLSLERPPGPCGLPGQAEAKHLPCAQSTVGMKVQMLQRPGFLVSGLMPRTVKKTGSQKSDNPVFTQGILGK